MCTVSFVRTNNKFIITSNRDEHTLRPRAIDPKWYAIQGKNICFPKDQKAGGTWYAIDESANAVVLLNGAIQKHTPRVNYRKSRGLIVLDLLAGHSPLQEWNKIKLANIEPFTIVLLENQCLYELQWNEIKKSTIKLNTNQSYIWSSATLYSQDIRENRANWFYAFLKTKPEINEIDLFKFHRYTEEENSEYGLVINRNNFLKTLSITQTVIENNKVEIHYSDLQLEREFSTTFIKV